MLPKWVIAVRNLVGFIDKLIEKTGRGISWLNTVLVLLICYDVFSRYLLNVSYVGILELEWHLFAFIFLLGAAFAYKHDRHVRVDVFYSKFSETKKAWTNLIGILVFLIPFCIIGIFTSIQFVANSFMIMEGSPDPGGLPARFIVKSAIPIGFFLLLLQGLAEFGRSLLQITGYQTEINQG